MKITQITVHAGRTFNHPFEQYSNFKPGVTLVANLDESDDAAACTRDLQAKAEELVEDHKRLLLAQVTELHQMTEAQAEMVSLERNLRAAQSRIEEIRKQHPQLAQLQLPASTPADS